MTDRPEELHPIAQAAALLGDGVTAAHVKAQVHRGGLDGGQSPDGVWRVTLKSVEQSLEAAPQCGGCGKRVA